MANGLQDLTEHVYLFANHHMLHINLLCTKALMVKPDEKALHL